MKISDVRPGTLMTWHDTLLLVVHAFVTCRDNRMIRTSEIHVTALAGSSTHHKHIVKFYAVEPMTVFALVSPAPDSM